METIRVVLDVRSKVEQLLRERGFDVSLNGELILAKLNSLNIAVWVTDRDYVTFENPLDFLNEMGFSKVDGVFVIAYRAFYLADEISKAMEQAKAWYGVKISTRVYAVSLFSLEEQFEEALNMLITTYIDKVAKDIEADGACPKCGAKLSVKFRHRHYSYRFKADAVEEVLICSNCLLKIHRILIR